MKNERTQADALALLNAYLDNKCEVEGAREVMRDLIALGGTEEVLTELNFPPDEIREMINEKIKLYQINFEKDEGKTAFLGSDEHVRHFKKFEINPAIYEKVFEGELGTNDLEELFRIFNTEHPVGYTGRSMSVSDIVVVNGKAYFCDTIGFKLVEFDESKVFVPDSTVPKNQKIFTVHISEVHGTNVLIRAATEDEARETAENLCCLGEINVVNDFSFGDRRCYVTEEKSEKELTASEKLMVMEGLE